MHRSLRIGLITLAWATGLVAPAAVSDRSASPARPGLDELKQTLPSAEDLLRPASGPATGTDAASTLPLTFRTDWTLAFAEAQADDRPVLVLFTTPNCIYCRRLKQTTFLQKAVKEAMRRFVLVEININQHKGTAYRLNVRGVPALAVFSSDERERGRLQGFVQGPQLVRFLDQMMAVPGDPIETRSVPWLDNLKAKTPQPEDWPEILSALGDDTVRRAIRDLVFGLPAFPSETLVAALSHQQLAVRLGALELLEEWSGNGFAYDPWTDPETPQNQDALKRWTTWARSAPEKRAAETTVLSDERIDAYIRDLAGDDATARHRAERMLQHGGKRAADRIDAALAAHPDWNEGVRNRMRGIKMGWLIDQIPGWDGHGSAHRLLHANRDIRLDLLRKLAAVPGRGAAILAEFADHPDALVRESALEGMIKSGGAALLPQVTQRVKTETNTDVRIAVLRQLGKIESKAAYTLLAEHITQPEEDVVLTALAGLARPKARSYLQKHIATLATDPRWRIRARALEAVHKSDVPLDAGIISDALEDPDSFVQRQALLALIATSPTQATKKVSELFTTNDDLKPALLSAFAQLKKPLSPELITHLKSRPKPVQLATLDQLQPMRNYGLSLASAYADHPDDDLASPALRTLASMLPSNPTVYASIEAALQPDQQTRALTTLRTLQQVTKMKKRSGSSSEPLARRFDLPATRVTLPANRPSQMAVRPEALINLFLAASQSKDALPPPPPAEPYAKVQRAVAYWLTSESAPHRLEAARLLVGLDHNQAATLLVDTIPGLPESERARIFYGIFNDGTPVPRGLLEVAFADPADRIFSLAVGALKTDASNHEHIDLFLNQLSTRKELPADLFTNYTFDQLVSQREVKKHLHRWAVQELAQTDTDRVNRALLTLFYVGSNADTELLLPQLRSANTWTRRLAVQTLARHDEAALVARFEALSNDPSIEVRSAFLEGLLSSGGGSQTIQFQLNDTARASDRISRNRRSSKAPALTPEQIGQLKDWAENGTSPRLRILAAQALWLRKESADMTVYKEAVAASSDPAAQWERTREFAEGNAVKLPDTFAELLPRLGIDTLPDYQVDALLRRFPELKKSRPRAKRTSPFAVQITETGIPEIRTEAGETTSEEPGEAVPPEVPAKLIVFYRQGCDDCARVDEWLEEVAQVIPGLVTERIDADQPGSQALYVQLLEGLSVSAVAGKTPAVFAGTGALLGDDISVPRLVELASSAAGIPAAEWDPRLQPDVELVAESTPATTPETESTVSTEPEVETAAPEVATTPETRSPATRTLPPLSASLGLIAALGLIPVVLSLRHHRPAALVAGLALYGVAAFATLLLQGMGGWRIPEGWSGDLMAVLGGLLPAIICLQRVLGSWQEKREWQGHLSILGEDNPQGFPILFPLVLGGLVGLLMTATLPALSPGGFLLWLVPALLLAGVLGPLRQRLPSARSLWASAVGTAAYAAGFIAFLSLGMA